MFPILDQLLANRKISAAFKAVDNNDVAALSKLQVDPNLARSAVLEGHTFNWVECLLSRAVRTGKHDVAQWLLNNGADPYSNDYLINDLVEGLRQDAACLVLKDGQVVKRGGIKGNGGLLSDPNTDFRISPVLTTLVALEHQRRTGNFAKRYGSNVVLSGPDVLDLPHIKQRFQEWLDVQVPRYEAEMVRTKLNAVVSTQNSAAPRKKI